MTIFPLICYVVHISPRLQCVRSPPLLIHQTKRHSPPATSHPTMRRLLATGLAASALTCLLLPATTTALNSTEVS
jgi:hypothetical protein